MSISFNETSKAQPNITWVEKMANEDKGGNKIKARVRAFALPLLATCYTAGYASITLTWGVVSVIKFSAAALVLCLPKTSKKKKELLLKISEMPGVSETVNLAVKTFFCFCAIVFSLPAGLISPQSTLKIYQFAKVGVTKSQQEEPEQKEKKNEDKELNKSKDVNELWMKEATDEADKLIEYIKNKPLAAAIGVSNPKGIMLTGYDSNSKKLFANHFAENVKLKTGKNYKVFTINRIAKEEKLKQIKDLTNVLKEVLLREKVGNGSVVYFEKADRLFMKSEKGGEPSLQEFKETILSFIDTTSKGNTFIFADVKDKESFIDRINRPALFNSSIAIELPIPNPQQLSSRLEKELSKVQFEQGLNINDWAQRHLPEGTTYEQVAAIAQLTLSNLFFEEAAKKERNKNEKAVLKSEHLNKAIASLGQTEVKEGVNNKKTGFESLVGMQQAKEAASEFIKIITNKELAAKAGVQQPAGILLAGPPGCGKTYFTEKFTEELSLKSGKECIMHSFTSSSIGSALVHETAKKIHQEFKKASKEVAKGKIAVVFIDEADTLFGDIKQNESASRNEEKGALLKELSQAAKKGIIVVAATNHKENLSEALIRDGRFDYKIEINPPSKEEIAQAFEQALKGLPLEEGLNVKEWSDQIWKEGMTFATVTTISQAVRRNYMRLLFNQSENKPEEQPSPQVTQQLLKDIAAARLPTPQS